MSSPKRTCRWNWLRRLRLRLSLLLAVLRTVPDKAGAERSAKEALAALLADYSAREAMSPLRTVPVNTEEVFDIAENAISFTKSVYWDRMMLMLRNMEKTELNVLLNPKEVEAHSIARASVAVCRKVMAMPYIDIEQGKAAIQQLDAYRAKVVKFKAR